VSPEYTAVSECVPADREGSWNMAVPPVSATPLTIVVEPSINVMVPVGVPPDPVTVAVRFTGCPTTEGFIELVSVVCVELNDALLTFCVSAADVLAV